MRKRQFVVGRRDYRLEVSAPRKRRSTRVLVDARFRKERRAARDVPRRCAPRDPAPVDPTLSARADFDASRPRPRRHVAVFAAEVQHRGGGGACARSRIARLRVRRARRLRNCVERPEVPAERSGRIVAERRSSAWRARARAFPTQTHNRCHLRRAPSLTENGARGKTDGRTGGQRGRRDRADWPNQVRPPPLFPLYLSRFFIDTTWSRSE